MTDQESIQYRLLNDIDSLRQVVNLQKFVWGENSDWLIPLHMLYSMTSNGCPVIGAFDGDLLVGASIAFFGMHDPDSKRPAMANLKLSSKRLVVHPDYRTHGIGYQLKLAQRRFANDGGIRLITWTFDPLVSRNAYFHVRKLGGLVRTYIINFYAEALGPEASIGEADRFICEWWVTSNRVEERLHGSRPQLTVEDYISAETPIVNPAVHTSDGLVLPSSDPVVIKDHSLQLVEIPPDNNPLINNPQLGVDWREHSREVIVRLFKEGYIVTDFVHQTFEGHKRSFYVLGFDGE